MNTRLLIVDDDPNVLASIKRNLRNSFDITVTTGGPNALELIKVQEPFAVILSDYQMPEMDGIAFLARSRELAPDAVRIMLTGQADMRVAVQAVNEGYIFQFLTKPCPTDQMENVLHAAVEHYYALQSEKELLDKTLKGSIKMLLDILAVTNALAFSQASRLRAHMKKIAERLKVPDLWEVELTALLSMIGCVTVPSDILHRRSMMESLNPKEMELYYSHARIGSGLLNNIPRLEAVSQAVKYQNKRFDGSGPPADGLRGEEIPYLGRLLKLVIDYDELSEVGMTGIQAMAMLRQRDSWYDPVMLATLEAVILELEPSYTVASVSLDDLEEGMITAMEIKDKQGRVLLTARREITPVIKEQLLNYHKMSSIVQPITVSVASINEQSSGSPEES